MPEIYTPLCGSVTKEEGIAVNTYRCILPDAEGHDVEAADQREAAERYARLLGYRSFSELYLHRARRDRAGRSVDELRDFIVTRIFE